MGSFWKRLNAWGTGFNEIRCGDAIFLTDYRLDAITPDFVIRETVEAAKFALWPCSHWHHPERRNSLQLWRNRKLYEEHGREYELPQQRDQPNGQRCRRQPGKYHG